MANWYFDPAASGTGSGDTPANAGTNMASLWSFMGSAWTHGDKLWVRRTSVASFGATGEVFNFGRTDFSTSSHAFSWAIGWPKSGQPFYADRPGEARSAGWDTDANTVYGNIDMATLYDLPTVANSIVLRSGLGLANFLFTPSAVKVGRSTFMASNQNPRMNMHLLNWSYNASNLEGFIDVTITTSTNLSPAFNAAEILCEKVTFTSSCLFGSAVFDNAQEIAIGEFVNNCNSIGGLFLLATAAPASPVSIRYIRAMRGIEPVNIFNQGATSRMFKVDVDDYFGKGPRVLIGRLDNNVLYPASGDAIVNSANVLTASYVESSNVAAGVQNRMRASYQTHQAVSDCREQIAYTQGVPLVMRWPVLVVGSTNIDPSSHGILPYAMIVGAGIAPGTVVANSGFTWSGASATAVGSAWVVVTETIPTSTGIGIAELMLHKHNAKNNDLIFFGRPEVNSL